MQSTIGVGVIGFGFMGRTHIAAYEAARRAGFGCELVALCDLSKARLTATNSNKGDIQEGNIQTGADDTDTLFDRKAVTTYTQVDAFLADPAVQVVSICTPTDTHVALGLEALRAAKHVLIEKPLAIASEQVLQLAEVAQASKLLCMPAMCMRFWPAWVFLHEAICDGRFGAVRSATFHRLGSMPAWSSFYADTSRSGGALFDLHIHDVDFLAWCFGMPRAVLSTGSQNHLTTFYAYPNSSHVVAEGGWAQDSGFGFKMRFVVSFENATLDFEIGRADELLCCHAGKAEPIALEPISGYDGEIRHLLTCIREGRTQTAVTVDDAMRSLCILEAEQQSLHNPMQPCRAVVLSKHSESLNNQQSRPQ